MRPLRRKLIENRLIWLTIAVILLGGCLDRPAANSGGQAIDGSTPSRYTPTPFPAGVQDILQGGTEEEGDPTSAWQRTNPGGGGAFGTIGAGPSGIVIAGSDLSGAYRSLDRGSSWSPIGAVQGLLSTHVSAVGFDPVYPDVIFLGTDLGIFRSEDAGESFQQTLESGYITDIQLFPNDPQIGFVAFHSDFGRVDGQLYNTSDNGVSWHAVGRSGLPSALRILELILDPRNSQVVYILAGEGRFACSAPAVYKSDDGGESWKQLGAALGQIMDLVVDPTETAQLYVTTYGEVWEEGYECVRSDPGGGHLYKSTDGGDSWTQLADRSGVIWLDADDDNAIRLIQPGLQFPWEPDNGVWESLDGGASWQQVSGVEDWDHGWTNDFFAYSASFDGEVKSLGADLSDPDTIYWVDSQFAYASFDDGRTFVNLYTTEGAPGQWQSTGIDNVVMFDVAISEANPSDIYLGYFDIGCWHSHDRGASWRNCNYPDATGDWEGWGGNTTSLLTDPSRPGVVWSVQAHSWDEPGTLLQSMDAGETWLEVGAGLPEVPLTGLSLDRNSPADQRTLFLTAIGDVFRSEDDGASWNPVLECGGCRYTAVDRFDSTLVYAGGEEGLWRSTGGGDEGTWVSIGVPEMKGAVAGYFWEWGWEGVSEITLDPHSSGTLYVAVLGKGRGLYRSMDNGDSWDRVLEDDFLRAVAVSPANPAVLMVGASSALIAGGYDPGSSGVLLTTDGGASWEAVNSGMAWPFANVVAFDPLYANWVIVGSPGTGFHFQWMAELVPPNSK